MRRWPCFQNLRKWRIYIYSHSQSINILLLQWWLHNLYFADRFSLPLLRFGGKPIFSAYCSAFLFHLSEFILIFISAIFWKLYLVTGILCPRFGLHVNKICNSRNSDPPTFFNRFSAASASYWHFLQIPQSRYCRDHSKLMFVSLVVLGFPYAVIYGVIFNEKVPGSDGLCVCGLN